MEDSDSIHILELGALTRKKVHRYFLQWRRLSVARSLKAKVALRSHCLRRGMVAFFAIVQRRRAVRHYGCTLRARVFRRWRRCSAVATPAPLLLGAQVLFCYKLIASCFREGPTHTFPWAGTEGSVDETAAKKCACRYRSYVIGRLQLPEKGLPLFIHSLAVLDAFQLRRCFVGWKQYHMSVLSLQQRPLKRMFVAWREHCFKRMYCQAAAVVLVHKRHFSSLLNSFRKWRTALKLSLCEHRLGKLQTRQAIRRWRLISATHRHSRRAFEIVSPHVKVRAQGLAFGAWMTVWLQRIRLQRVSNRIVCNRFDALQRYAWVSWRAIYKGIQTCRSFNKERLHDAAALTKAKKRSRQHLVDRETRRVYFRKWIILYSYRARGQHMILTWYNFHRKRKLLRALRHWILLFSVETIATCVQKNWRGYQTRFIAHPETWARVRWYRHYLQLCYLLMRANAKKRVLRTWIGYLKSQFNDDTQESASRSQTSALRRFRHRFHRHKYARLATDNCYTLYVMTIMRAAIGALDFRVCVMQKARSRDETCTRLFGKLLQRRCFAALQQRKELNNEKKCRKTKVRHFWSTVLLDQLRILVYQRRIFDVALRQNSLACIFRWRKHIAKRFQVAYAHRQVLLKGIGKPLLYKWVMYKLGRQLSRLPGNSSRLGDIRRVGSVLVNRADRRRSQYVCDGSLGELFIFPRSSYNSEAMYCGRVQSAWHGLKYCYLRKWHRKTKIQKKVSRHICYFNRKYTLTALRVCLDRWISVGFSQVKWRRAAIRHHKDRMEMWRVRTCFSELKRPLVLRRRENTTIAVNRLLSALLRSFRHWKMGYFSRCTAKERNRIAGMHLQRNLKFTALTILRCRSKGASIPARWCVPGQYIETPDCNSSATPSSKRVKLRGAGGSRLFPDMSTVFVDTPVRSSFLSPSQTWTPLNTVPPPPPHDPNQYRDRPFRSHAQAKSRTYEISFDQVVQSNRVDCDNLPPEYKKSELLQRFISRLPTSENRSSNRFPFASVPMSIWHEGPVVRHLSAANVCRYDHFAKLQGGMRVLYRNALYKVALRRTVRRCSLVPTFISWRLLYVKTARRRIEVRNIHIRISFRLVRGVFMAWAFHTMRCRRLAYQVGVVRHRHRMWRARRSLDHWLHLMAWDKCSRAFISVLGLRTAKLVKKTFFAWRQARLIVSSLDDALYQLTFTGWVWYIRGKKIKGKAIKKANRFFYMVNCDKAIRCWRSWVAKRRHASLNSSRARHQYNCRNSRRILLYWLYWTWWMGRLVLFSRKGSRAQISASRSEPYPRRTCGDNSPLPRAYAVHRSSRHTPGANALSTPKKISFSPVQRSPTSSFVSRFPSFSRESHSSRPPSTRVSMTPVPGVTPFKALAEKRIPWLAPRICARSGRRHIPGLQEARQRHGLYHWLRITKSRLEIWRLSTRRRLFILWKVHVFAIKNLRAAFLSRLKNMAFINFSGYYFAQIKREAHCNRLQRKLTSYFQSQRRRQVFSSWRRVYWFRVRLRTRLRALEASAAKMKHSCSRRALADAFVFWKISLFHRPALDLRGIGAQAFLSWQAAMHVRKFNKVMILRRTFRAWISRVVNLSKMRIRVLHIRKACSLLETRFRHQLHTAIHRSFDRWAGRQTPSRPISVNNWKEMMSAASQPIYGKPKPAVHPIHKQSRNKSLVFFPTQFSS